MRLVGRRPPAEGALQDAVELRATGTRKELYEALKQRHLLVVHEDGTAVRTQTGLLVVASMSLLEQPDVMMTILTPSLRRHEVAAPPDRRRTRAAPRR